MIARLSSSSPFLFLGFLLLASPALAGCSSESSQTAEQNIDPSAPGTPVHLSFAKYDASTRALEFRYGTSGGCAAHAPKTTVLLAPTSPSEIEAKVLIADVSEPDPCEAFLTLGGSVDLGALVDAEAARTQQVVAGRLVGLTLPPFRMAVGAPTGRSPRAPLPTDVVNDVDLSLVTFDATSGKLEYGYRLSGGCASHAPLTRVELTEPRPGSFAPVLAKVSIVDVASAPDSCEALIHRSGDEDLRSLIADAALSARRDDLSGKTIDVELPRISTWWH